MELLKNDQLVIGAIVIVCLLSAIVVVRALLIWKKRPMRRGELIHHILMILDKHGCQNARKHYNDCKHIVMHYGIPLESVADQTGFYGDLALLLVRANESEIRAERRGAEQVGRPVTGSKHGDWRTGAVSK